MTVRASIVIPAYNCAATIERCLLAAATQTIARSEYEIIVVDDGSTDGTAEVAENIPDVRVIRAFHRGAAAARNRGVDAAQGSVVLFTDADCAPAENWIQEMLAPFTDPQVVGVKGVYRTQQCGLVPRFVQLEYEEKYQRMTKVTSVSRAAAIDFVDTYSAAYRRDVFLANGGFDESFPTASVEDQEFSFRLAKQGHRLVFAPQAVVYHRHVTTLRAYARRKFRIGYWKVRVLRRHPGKTWKDAHTPTSLKLQVAGCLVAMAGLLAIPFNPMAWLLLLAGLMITGITTLPLVAFIARRDCSVALIAPVMILTRAVSLATGLIFGVMGEVSRSARLKRAMDVLGSIAGLALFAPLMACIAILIKLDSSGPVFFVQWRCGKAGEPFRMWKFRTMVDGAEALLDQVIAASSVPPPVFKIPNDPRVTRVGRFLRRFSLDELPQFINVLKGEMSLVGPRPEEPAIVKSYTHWHLRRLAVKPGMTGPMQTNGRGALSLDDRVRLELAYINNYSLWQDLRLLAKTLPAVIRGQGSY